MMAAGKKNPEEQKTDTPGSTRSLRDDAEGQLARTPKNSRELNGQTPGQLIHELQVHQVELETQAEELKRAHLALEESRDKYLGLYEFAPVGYLTLTDTALIAEVNLFGAALLATDRKKLLNARFRKFIAHNDSECWVKYFVDVLDKGEKQVCTLMLKRGNDSMFPAHLEGVRVSDSDGATTVRITFSDISDIWQIAALAESEKRLKSYIDNAPDGVFIADEAGRYLEVNPAACRITGYEREELLAMHIPDMLPPESPETGETHFTEVIKSGHEYGELQFLHKDGSLRYWSVDAVRLSATRFMGFAKDITERKVSEEALRQSEEKYRGIFDESVAAVYVFDNKKNFINSNKAGLDLLGYSREELLQLSIPDVDADPVVVLPAHQELLSGGRLINYEHRLRRKDGTIISVINNSSPLMDHHGNVVGMISTLIDITERRKAEDALRRVNQKLNVLSQLTRTELTSQVFLLDGYVEMAKIYAAGQDRIIEPLKKGEKAIRLLRGTIAYSKDYQDMGVTPPVWQNVKRTMLFGLSHLPISSINHSLETENLEVFADPLLEKACQRLFENSLDHGGHVSRVRVWHTVTPDGVNLVFEDDGVGIPVEMKEQIFLHDENTRTSVRGLFFIREILDITGITITETGEPGKGARFEMAVPKGMWRSAGRGT